MSPVPFSGNSLQSKDYCVLDLTSLVEDSDMMECELPEEDFLQQLSSDLEIPMLLEESLHSDREMDSLFEASSFFKEFDDWGMDPVFHKGLDTLPQVSVIKEEINIEADGIPSSPSSQSQDSWSSSSSSSEAKNILETPPISPPPSSSGSPPRTPTPPLPPPTPSPPILMLGGKPIKIVPLKHGAQLTDGKTKVVLPKQFAPKNVILQPRPVNMASLPVTSAAPNGQKTLVLSPKNLSALTNQVAVNKPVTPAEIRIVSPLNTSNVNVKTLPPERQDIQLKALKRQQRMIKNRESACLSRKKKKEYISSLEFRISELEKENLQLKTENDALRARLCECDPTIAKRTKTVFNVNIKKTAILAVLLVVSVNLGSLSFLSRSRSGADAVLSMPDVTLSRHSGRRLLWADADLQNLSTSSSPSSPAYSQHQHPTCPLHINQTESLRLDSELRRWIGAERPSYSNNSEEDSDIVEVQLARDSRLMLSDSQTPPIIPRHRRKLKLSKKEVDEVELMVPAGPGLFGALNRRDDTFYVVSFSGNHLLLPAAAHNDSVRPKMSLVLPALPFNSTLDASASSVTMMQIDCEVLDTRTVELSERDIPTHLRQAKPSSDAQRHKNVSQEEEEPVRSSYRPYFVRSNNFVDPYSPVQPRGPRDPKLFS